MQLGFAMAARVAIVLTTLMAISAVEAQSARYDALANSAMAENRPTPETIKLLKDELLFQRGTQIIEGNKGHSSPNGY